MSAVKLSDDHFILQSSNDVSTICDPFLRHFNLTYFDYCRIYKDGRMSVLATDPAWVKHFFAANYPAGGEVRQKGIYLWPTHLPEQAITDARNFYNHENGITAIFECDGYIEFFDKEVSLISF